MVVIVASFFLFSAMKYYSERNYLKGYYDCKNGVVLGKFGIPDLDYHPNLNQQVNLTDNITVRLVPN